MTKRVDLDAVGIDAICACLGNCETLTDIAAKFGVSLGKLNAWLEADSERSARAREARRSIACFWDEKSETVISAATDPFELARAKELAHHYRWRAAKIAPKEYGDKLALDHSGEMTLKNTPDDQLESKLADLIRKAGVTGAS